MSIPRQAASAKTGDVTSLAARGAPTRASDLPVVVALDDTDTPYDVIDALALGPFTTGEQPWARTARIDRLRPGASLLPSGSRPLRGAVETGRESQLAAGEGWTLRAVKWRGGGAEVTVTAVSEDLARTVLDRVVRGAVADPPPERHVTVGFWHMSSRRGPVRTPREIAAAPWDTIRRNYAETATAQLDALMAVRRETVFGRIVLLHGPAGTGKTTLLRTLAHEWRGWCQVDCVLDPEALFADPGYMVEAAVGYDASDDEEDDGPDDDRDHDRGEGLHAGEVAEEGEVAEGADRAGDGGVRGDARPAPGPARPEPGERRRWRLLVVEDCDELIRADAGPRGGTSPALSRLLNLTDGLAGQGRDVLVALTTNEPISHTHPAVVRPGRCLAQVEVGPFPYGQAVAWLGTETGVRSEMTLAELYALRDGRTAAPAPRFDRQVGPYL